MRGGLSLWLWSQGLLLSLLFSKAHGECAGACSGHGVCAAFDTCLCFKGYMGGNCAQRICQFGHAHVDIPKGDLDSSKHITGIDTHVATYSNLFWQGTTEQYPSMVDTMGSRKINSAHEYVECSNKGDCNRNSGLCECLEGYEGSACQRATCPISNEGYCSGHGICASAREIADADHHNVYELWDADISMGCICDSGYYGPGCEHRTCKHGVDPMFLDAEGSHRFSNISYVIFVTDKVATITGNYSIEFYDVYGESWQTKPIDYGASCLSVIEALEGLPNNVIPKFSVRCTAWTNYKTIPHTDEPIHFSSGSNYNGIKYTLAFPGNPGILKPLKIRKFLDGRRPTLFSSEAKSTLKTFVYPNGFIGEHDEYWVEKCIGVELTLRHQPGLMEGSFYVSQYSYITGLSKIEMRLLQRCLGDADGKTNTLSATGRIEGQDYEWDYGDIFNPHIVRLVDITDPNTVVTDLCDRRTDDDIASGIKVPVNSSHPNVDGGRSGNKGRSCTYEKPNPGFYAAIYYDPFKNQFILMNRAAIDYSPNTNFAVWTTKGHAQMVSDEADIYTAGDRSDMYSHTVYTTNSTSNFTQANGLHYDGIIACENNKESRNGAFTCLEKNDHVFFLDKARAERNPQYFNIYKVEKIHVESLAHPDAPYGLYRNRIELDYAINSNFHDPNKTNHVRAYKFFPPQGYTYVSECSNRGLCETTEGICTCFPQFVGLDCSQLELVHATADQNGV